MPTAWRAATFCGRMVTLSQLNVCMQTVLRDAPLMLWTQRVDTFLWWDEDDDDLVYLRSSLLDNYKDRSPGLHMRTLLRLGSTSHSYSSPKHPEILDVCIITTILRAALKLLWMGQQAMGTYLWWSGYSITTCQPLRGLYWQCLD